jgi:hypothetical protein
MKELPIQTQISHLHTIAFAWVLANSIECFLYASMEEEEVSSTKKSRKNDT